MKRIAAVILCAAINILAGSEPEMLDHSHAKLFGVGILQGNHVICEVSPQRAKGINGVIFEIDLTPYQNSFVTFSVHAKAENLSKPEQRFLGTKFMLLYATPDGNKHYAESNGHFGSFDKELQFSHTVEPDAGKAQLRFSVQNVSGKVVYDLSTFQITESFRKFNPTHICEYSDTIKNRPVRRGVMSPIINQDNEDNFKALHAWNVNLMRLQLNISNDYARNKPDLYDKIIDEKIDQVIPRVLALGEKYGIAIIIDLHMVPGGNDTQKGSPGIFGSEEAVERFITIWKRIATVFKGHKALYGYGLFNEPRQNFPARFDYWEIQRMAAEEIRKIDSETPIYIASNLRNSQYTFTYLSPLTLKNIIYEVHCYEPFLYTHTPYLSKDKESGNVRPSYPSTYLGASWDAEGLRMRLQPVIDFARKHQAKIYVGEFSARAGAPGGDQLLRDYINVFEENNWDWTYHAFREAKIWSLEYDGPADDALTPSENNPRKQVMLKAYKKNMVPSHNE